ncbi:MAG: prepilin-type N-terminal cleavage/methylation domain-containing protein [Planctomycetota bacterium]
MRQIRAYGFTVVEVMIATSILAIAALGFAAAVPSSYKLSEDTKAEARIHRALSSISAALEATPFAEAAVQWHMRGFDVPGLTPQKGDADALPGEIEFAPAPGNIPNCYRITIRVRWMDTNGSHVTEEVRILSNVRDDPGDPVELDAIQEFHGAGNGYFPNREYFYR